MTAKQGVTLRRTNHANRVPLAALLALCVVAGCAVGGARIVGPSTASDSSTTPGGPSSTPPPGSAASAAVATVVVTAPSSSVGLLQTLQAQAVAYDASGKVVQGISFAWASSNTAAATVSNTGLITARFVGTTDITAVSGSVTSPALTVTVTP